MAYGCGLCLEITIRFLGEKCLKNALYKFFFFTQKLLQITIRNFWCKNLFDCPTGVVSALIAQFVFLVKSALKMRCTAFFYETKVVTNQNSQLLCYLTFVDILHHYGVIAASQICSVFEKVFCRLTEQIFLFLFFSRHVLIEMSILPSCLYCVWSEQTQREVTSHMHYHLFL